MFNHNKCAHCGAALNPDADFCTKCGSPAPKAAENRCSNPSCVRCTTGFDFGPDDLYCDKCGKPTTVGKIVDSLA